MIGVNSKHIYKSITILLFNFDAFVNLTRELPSWNPSAVSPE